MAKKKTPSTNLQTTEELILAAARENYRKFGTLIPSFDALLPVMKKRCPKCGHEGLVLKDFGLQARSYDGAIRAQSWCRPCRNGRDAHPTRFGYHY